MSIISNSFTASFLIFVASRADFTVPPFYRIASSHISRVFYLTEAYFITNDSFLTVCLHMFLFSSWSGTNFSISGFSIIAPIQIFKVVLTIFTINQLFLLYWKFITNSDKNILFHNVIKTWKQKQLIRTKKSLIRTKCFFSPSPINIKSPCST